jgi:membrane protein YqaA with SNARE-associated domain
MELSSWLATPSLLAQAVGTFVVYVLGLFAYRLFFHPLAKFPGPKLAALSNWYEFYYDVLQHGKFTEHIQALHKKYGK